MSVTPLVLAFYNISILSSKVFDPSSMPYNM